MGNLPADKRRLVVLGCGFGGFSLLRGLRRSSWQTTLVSPRNYFLFTPLLPSAVSGSVEFRSILEPARWHLRGSTVIEALAESVDFATRLVRCRAAITDERFAVPYDRLVIAVGARPADYGVAGVAAHGMPLATVEDARAIRRRILECLASADLPGLAESERRRRATFVICGGGPTGVEVAAEIHDLLYSEARRAYPLAAPRARVVLVEAGPKLLSMFDAALGDYAGEHFRRGGIEVRTSTPVRALEADRVVLADGSVVPCGCVVWAAGNAPVDLLRGIGLPLDARGRLPVDERLRVIGVEGVWALGDCAGRGAPALPATAQVAQQEGRYLARELRRESRGKAPRPFRYRALGMLAYIGGAEALADLPRVKARGWATWLFWRSVYLTRLVSLANKAKVLFDWSKAAIFGRDLSRF